MEAYSVDLRTRVVSAQGSTQEVAKRYDVSLSFVQRMRRLFNATGGVAIKPKGGMRPPAVDTEGGKWLVELIEKENDIILLDMCARYEERFGVKVSKSAMDRTLHRLKITRKKKRNTTPK